MNKKITALLMVLIMALSLMPITFADETVEICGEDVSQDDIDPMELNNYPWMFIEDQEFDGLFVVGSAAAPSDIITMTDIIVDLQFSNCDYADSTCKITVGAGKLDTEITDISAQNIISVGSPCVNSVTAELLGLTYPACGTSNYVEAEEGILKLVENGDHVALIVSGWGNEDLSRVSEALMDDEQVCAMQGSEVTLGEEDTLEVEEDETTEEPIEVEDDSEEEETEQDETEEEEPMEEDETEIESEEESEEETEDDSVRQRIEKLREKREAHKEKLKERKEQIKERMAKAREKYSSAKERFEAARERYAAAKERYVAAKEHYQQTKPKFLAAKEKFRRCEGLDTEECTKIREDMAEKTKPYLDKTADVVLETLNKVYSKVEGSEDLSDEERDGILAQLEEDMAEVEAAKEVIANVDGESSEEEIRDAIATIKEAWAKSKRHLKHGIGKLVNAKLGNIAHRADKISERFNALADKLAEDGFDTSALEASIDEFEALVAEAKENHEAARAKFQEAKDSEESEGLVQEAHELMRAANENLKESKKLIREIVKDIKELNKGSLEVEDESEDETESEDESEEETEEESEEETEEETEEESEEETEEESEEETEEETESEEDEEESEDEEDDEGDNETVEE